MPRRRAGQRAVAWIDWNNLVHLTPRPPAQENTKHRLHQAWTIYSSCLDSLGVARCGHVADPAHVCCSPQLLLRPPLNMRLSELVSCGTSGDAGASATSVKPACVASCWHSKMLHRGPLLATCAPAAKAAGAAASGAAAVPPMFTPRPCLICVSSVWRLQARQDVKTRNGARPRD